MSSVQLTNTERGNAINTERGNAIDTERGRLHDARYLHDNQHHNVSIKHHNQLCLTFRKTLYSTMADSDDESVVLDDDNGVTAEATSLLEHDDEKTDAVRIVCNGKERMVPLEAKQAMGVAIEASSNKPTIFYRMDCVVSVRLQI